MSDDQARTATTVPTIDPTGEQDRRSHTGGPDDTAEPEGQFPSGGRAEAPDADHEGATEGEVGDRTGPGAGYDQEPEQERDRGGVA